MNDITHRIAEDLNCLPRPKEMPESMFRDQMVYAALSEWIRVITLDVDPILGNSKAGVTRGYLEERAACVLMDLSKLNVGVEITKEHALACARWMVSAMLEIGELWHTHADQVACAAYGISSYRGKHARVKGIMEKDKGIAQAGLCHFLMKESPEEEVEKFENARLAIEKAILRTEPTINSINGCSYEENLELLKGLCSINEQDCGLIITLENLDDLPRPMRQFILTHAWPMSFEPIAWPNANTWLIRNIEPHPCLQAKT